jgi:hypothetical protein
MSTVNYLLQKLVEAFESKDNEEVEEKIKLLPLKSINQKTFDKIFEQFSVACFKGNNTQGAVFLLHTWNSFYNNKNQSYATHLFFNRELDDDLLQFVLKASNETDAFFHLSELLEDDPSDDLLVAAERIVTLFGTGKLGEDDIKGLLTQAQDRQNFKLENYFGTLLTRIAAPAEKPEWVYDVHNLKILPSEQDLLLIAPVVDVNLTKDNYTLSDEEAVHLATDGLAAQGIYIEDMERSEEELAALLRIMTVEEKAAFFEPVYKNIATYRQGEDKELLTYFGPSNVQVDAILTTDHECCKYGGCRMLLCRCFERYDFDDDEDVVDEDPNLEWFAGYCLQCRLTILHKWYALRLPIPTGGWKGTYCSFKCLREASPNILTTKLIDRIEVSIKKSGIQDRVETVVEKEEDLDENLFDSVEYETLNDI